MTTYSPTNKNVTTYTSTTNPSISIPAGLMIGFFAPYTYSTTINTQYTSTNKNTTSYTPTNKN